MCGNVAGLESTQMETYNEKLSDAERACIENALDMLKLDCAFHGVKLANDDRAARAAEALAVYIVDSKGAA